MTNVIELAKQAGFSGSVAKMWEAHFAEFATLVRNAALEEAAQKCEKLEIEHLEVNGNGCAAELRNLKEPT